ncbi:MAG: trypsin-like peptidase domain-containing protein [Chloroflexota bacterium]|nr:trypsin-like peptidase domain-containing protein [Chloroflexota bacterium]
MQSNQRGPVLVIALLAGSIFLCLCLAVGAVAVGQMANNMVAAPPAPVQINRLPTSTPPAAKTNQPAATPSINTPVEPAVNAPSVIIEVEPGADVESQILRAVYRKVNPSVVKVVSLGNGQLGGMDEDELFPQGQGSGFVWDASGLIVTNAHVVTGADGVQIVFLDDRVTIGQVLGADPNSDLAVIEINPEGFNLQAVERGNIDDVQVGDRAIAIGAPFDFAGSMTSGTISGLGRSIRSLNMRYTIPEVIQTDAPINPGNSGGPLLNSRGQIIGINAQIRTEGDIRANSGVGFAIPIYIAERVVPALAAGTTYEHPFIGVSGQTYSPEWSDALGFSRDVKGAYVTEALDGYPADLAGLVGAHNDTDVVIGIDMLSGEPVHLRSGGDLITGINDRPVERFDDLLIYLFRFASPGDVVQLTTLRADGSQVVIPVELGVRPGR